MTRLTTEELKNYFEQNYIEKIKKVVVDFPEPRFYFGEPEKFKFEDKIYIFSDEKGYHVLEPDWHVVHETDYDDVWELAYRYINFVISSYAQDYELKNRVEGQDTRRIWFKKALEIWKAIDERGFSRKEKEIQDILSESPFVDE